jgi:AcrR family transcriptional regulator
MPGRSTAPSTPPAPATAAAVAAGPVRQLPRRARREAILGAAAVAFGRAGYAATSMEDIAAESGVTKLIVYRHFDSKEALYRSVLEQVFTRQAELFVHNIAQGLQAAGATRALLSVARELPDGFRLLWRHAAREPQFADYAHDLRDIAVSAAREVVSAVVAGPVAEWAAQTLFDQLVDAVLNWLDYGEPASDEQFVVFESAATQAMVVAWRAQAGSARTTRG